MKPTAWAVCLSYSLLSQPWALAEPVTVPFESSSWRVEAATWEPGRYLGREAVLLQGGTAWIDEEPFVDGWIEFDIAFGRERNFVGAVWRMQTPEETEFFYFRPHQSGNPDANQYTPEFHGLSSWQLYHGAPYGAPLEYRFDQWQKVRIAFSGGQAELYVDSDEPVAFFPELKRAVEPGRVGLSAGQLAPVYYSNFRYQPLDNPTLVGLPVQLPAPPVGVLDQWKISSAFGRVRLTDDLSASDLPDLTWSALAAESTGIVNLARVQGVTQEVDTAFAEVTIRSEAKQTKRVRFGYSDAVIVYLNGHRIYSGHRMYQSRDYRYLGTMGLFDELSLALREGENELRFAVSERFGGWGLIAAIEDREGIELP